MAKDFFKDNNIEFENFDVSTDPIKRQEMIEKSQQMGVPVIFIEDQMIIGFDKDRISQLLGV